jgi:hypothetical protein
MKIILWLTVLLTLLHLPALAARRWAKPLLAALLVVDSLFLGLAAMEAYFTYAYDQSDGFDLTMAGHQWFARHWQPLNSLGYRDQEPQAPAKGEKVLAVLGDSFAAGHGINDPSQRFGDVLGRKLGQSFVVLNVAKCGWATPEELDGLRSFPVRPDVVVLAYVLNDIYDAAREKNFPLAWDVRFPRSKFLKYLVDNSALVNFAYWRYYRLVNASVGEQDFWGSLKKAYQDPVVWARHRQEIEELAGYCRERHIRLLAVIFPMLPDVAGSAPLSAKVAQAFEEAGAQVLDLSPVLAGRDPKDMVVNANDAHPNEALNREVAGMLYPLVSSWSSQASDIGRK